MEQGMLAWTTAASGPSSPREEVEISLAGSADLTTAEELRGNLRRLAGELIRDKSRSVRFDVRELHFMNSSCVKEVITFVDVLRGNMGFQCRVQFVGDKRHAWQRRTLRVLKLMEPDIVGFAID